MPLRPAHATHRQHTRSVIGILPIRALIWRAVFLPGCSHAMRVDPMIALRYE
jgi:hypothetical protein